MLKNMGFCFRHIVSATPHHYIDFAPLPSKTNDIELIRTSHFRLGNNLVTKVGKKYLGAATVEDLAGPMTFYLLHNYIITDTPAGKLVTWVSVKLRKCY